MTITVLPLPLPALTTNSIFALGNITVSGGYYASTYGGASGSWNTAINYSPQPNGIGGVVSNTSLQVKSQGLLEISGEKADILINGVSLNKTLDGISDRLGFMRPDPRLEAEWDELLELGKRYRQLEADINEKIHMWDLIKKEY